MYLLNGESRHSIDISDRGLQYGDGLFETLEVLNGKPLFWQQHLARLQKGCKKLLITCPDTRLLHQEAQQVIKQTQQGVLKIIITRGSGGRGYRLPATSQPTRLLSLHPKADFPESYYQQGINMRFCRHRLGLNPDLAGIKHLNRLEQVMARSEWQDADIQEGLMSDTRGFVIEGTMSNIFFVKQKKIYTPALNLSGVAGIVRGLVFDIAWNLGIEIIETQATVKDIIQADELFISNSVIGIWPVARLEKYSFQAGPLTKQIQQVYQDLRLQQAADD